MIKLLPECTLYTEGDFYFRFFVLCLCCICMSDIGLKYCKESGSSENDHLRASDLGYELSWRYSWHISLKSGWIHGDSNAWDGWLKIICVGSG